MRKKTILVIDDDEMNLKVAKMLLERKLPCEVLCASSGFDGLEILRNRRVNLILLDILMPEFDGIETLQKIRGDERIKNIPVMMLTASGDVENIKKVGTLGVKDYIIKPFVPADLINRIEKKLSEINSADILLIGDDKNELRDMKDLIEKNFPHEARTAATFDEAIKILRDKSFDLIIASSNMKFVDGFKILQFVAANDKLSAVPFTLTTSEKILGVIDELNASRVEEKISGEHSTIHDDKKKIANVVTNLIGYELDLHI